MGQMMTRRRLLLIILLALMLCIAPSLASGQGNTLQYCILSHERIAQNGFRDFVVDYLLSQRRDLQIQLFKAGDDQTPLRSWNLQPTAQKPHIFRWDGLIKGQTIAPGGYLLRFEVKDEAPRLLQFEGHPSGRKPLPLAVSEEALFLPQTLDDASVWQALSAPIAVVDIGATAHQPSGTSRAKGPGRSALCTGRQRA